MNFQFKDEENALFERRKRKLQADRKYRTKIKSTKGNKKKKKKSKRKGKKGKKKTIIQFLTENKNKNLQNHQKLVSRFKLLQSYGPLCSLYLKDMLKYDYKHIKLIKKHQEFGKEIIMQNLVKYNEKIFSTISLYKQDL